jgi:hypothetical protein
MSSNKKRGQVLMRTIALGSTDDARKLLIEKNIEPAKNLPDLEYKLALLYQSTPNKTEIEKQLADIHPHKDFILKYLSPKEVDKELPINNESENKIVAMATDSTTSNCEGNPNCGCNKSNINGDYSNVGGETQNSQTNQNQVYMLGFVSIVAIFGMVLIYKQK